MSTNTGSAYSWEPGRTQAITEHILAKGDLMPSFTAVRHSGAAASYGQLAEATRRYTLVVNGHAIDPATALPAAVLHCLPDVVDIGGPTQVADALAEILTWLGRDLPDIGETGVARAG